MGKDKLASVNQVKYARYMMYQWGKDTYTYEGRNKIWKELDPANPPSEERIKKILDDLKETMESQEDDDEDMDEGEAEEYYAKTGDRRWLNPSYRKEIARKYGR